MASIDSEAYLSVTAVLGALTELETFLVKYLTDSGMGHIDYDSRCLSWGMSNRDRDCVFGKLADEICRRVENLAVASHCSAKALQTAFDDVLRDARRAFLAICRPEAKEDVKGFQRRLQSWLEDWIREACGESSPGEELCEPVGRWLEDVGRKASAVAEQTYYREFLLQLRESGKASLAEATGELSAVIDRQFEALANVDRAACHFEPQRVEAPAGSLRAECEGRLRAMYEGWKQEDAERRNTFVHRPSRLAEHIKRLREFGAQRREAVESLAKHSLSDLNRSALDLSGLKPAMDRCDRLELFAGFVATAEDVTERANNDPGSLSFRGEWNRLLLLLVDRLQTMAVDAGRMLDSAGQSPAVASPTEVSAWQAVCDCANLRCAEIRQHGGNYLSSLTNMLGRDAATRWHAAILRRLSFLRVQAAAYHEQVGDLIAGPRLLAWESEPIAADGQVANDQARHSPDFRSVVWFGQPYQFTSTQAACVRILWEAWEQKTPDVGQDTILEKADSAGNRLLDIFRGHPAWGTMIVQGATKGTFRLAVRPASGK